MLVDFSFSGLVDESELQNMGKKNLFFLDIVKCLRNSRNAEKSSIAGTLCLDANFVIYYNEKAVLTILYIY